MWITYYTDVIGNGQIIPFIESEIVEWPYPSDCYWMVPGTVSPDD